MRRPAFSSLFLGLIPFVAACFTVTLWDRIQPIVLGLPFNFFWALSWMVLTPVCLWGAYRIETRRDLEAEREAGAANPAARGGVEGGGD